MHRNRAQCLLATDGQTNLRICGNYLWHFLAGAKRGPFLIFAAHLLL